MILNIFPGKIFTRQSNIEETILIRQNINYDIVNFMNRFSGL